ncbi:MYCBP-associated protein isoform X4 [Scyliorhinus canicula]|uniref:MYCBP-associated protein isoform X4 n=1 Tax=Scyliorhinus canicula TaxID=7830 RepID=UPI0018F44FF0|nr:MYCBP-associated protein isoform X4 [Scyliorhinus canicula]
MGTRTPFKGARRDGGLRTPPGKTDREFGTRGGGGSRDKDLPLGVEKKKEIKKEVEEVSPILEEPEKEDILKGEDIMALAIKTEDLNELHGSRMALNVTPITSRLVIRKQKLKKEVIIKRLIAKPAPPLDELKTVDYSGPGGPRFNAEGRVLPHSILGNLADFKQELLARGLTEIANAISDRHPTEIRPQELQVYDKKSKDIIYAKSQNQDHALVNWQWHMAERKKTQQLISNLLNKPVGDLVMNQCEDFGQTRQQANLLDQTIASLGPGKGFHVGSEFWALPPMIGDELSGVASTLTQTERGFPPPIIHSGKPRTIKQETGTDFPCDKKTHRKSNSENLHLKQRLEEMKTVLRHLDFRQPDIDQLEVIGTGRPFSSMSVERFPLEQKDCPTEGKENINDLLEQYPDVIEEPIIGPSIMFSGQPARWLNDTCSHKNEVAMIVRLTFEAMAGDRVISCLQVINDGTTVIYYKWKRLPEPEHCIVKPSYSLMQKFYFNTNSDVILPGDTVNLPFTFKSTNAGIFTEFWEFCTHPVVLAGASLQVALWGVALFEDKNESARQQLQEELEEKEKKAIIELILNEVIAGVRTPQRSPSPIEISFIEEEVFERKNPKLHYKFNIVQSLKELWKQCFLISRDAEEAEGGKRPRGVSASKDKPQAKQREQVEKDKGTATKRQSPDEVEEQPKQRGRSHGKLSSQRAEHSEQIKQLDKATPTNKASPTDEPEEPSKVKTRTHSRPEQKQGKKTRSHGKKSARHVEQTEHLKPPETTSTTKAQPPDESEPEWDLSINSFRQDVLTLLKDEEQKEKALEQLNLKVLELSTAPFNIQENVFYKVLYQLWQGTVDELVSYSMLLREVMSLPDKEIEGSVIVEETLASSVETEDGSSKRTVASSVETEDGSSKGAVSKKTGKKDEKKPADKKGKKGAKSAGKDDEKEKRLSSKKTKSKEDKKSSSPTSLKGSKQAASRESPEQDQNQEDPVVLQMYREKLYMEVYGLVQSMMDEFSFIFDDLKGQDTEPLDKCV